MPLLYVAFDSHVRAWPCCGEPFCCAALPIPICLFRSSIILVFLTILYACRRQLSYPSLLTRTSQDFKVGNNNNLRLPLVLLNLHMRRLEERNILFFKTLASLCIAKFCNDKLVHDSQEALGEQPSVSSYERARPSKRTTAPVIPKAR